MTDGVGVVLGRWFLDHLIKGIASEPWKDVMQVELGEKS